MTNAQECYNISAIKSMIGSHLSLCYSPTSLLILFVVEDVKDVVVVVTAIFVASFHFPAAAGVAAAKPPQDR